MRGFGAKFDQIPVLPDTVGQRVLAGGTGEAVDYPTDTDVVRLSAATTASGVYGFVFNPSSTAAAWPADDQSSTTASTGLNIVVPPGESRIYQRPSGSTGFSLISGTSGIVSYEFWKRGG